MFSLTESYTKDEGAAVTIEILSLKREFMLSTKGLLVTGSADCLMNASVAEAIGLRSDIPCLVAVSDGQTRIEHEVIFRATAIDREAILGVSFMRHFVIDFNGPKQTVTLISPS